MASTEEKVKSRLIKYLKQHNLHVKSKEKLMPDMKYDEDKKSRPDIIAYTKRGKKILLIECKTGSKPRVIGQAFGQMLAIKISLKKTNKDKLAEWLKKNADTDIDKARFIFCVAFPKKHFESKSIKKLIDLFMIEDSFKDFRVYKVGERKDIRKLQKGKLISYEDLTMPSRKPTPFMGGMNAGLECQNGSPHLFTGGKMSQRANPD